MPLQNETNMGSWITTDSWIHHGPYGLKSIVTTPTHALKVPLTLEYEDLALARNW